MRGKYLLCFLPAFLLAVSAPGYEFLAGAEHDFAEVVPPPPADDSPAGLADLDTVLQLQKERTPEQIARAKKVSGQSPFSFGASVLGDWFTPQNLPHTGLILEEINREARPIVDAAKRSAHRLRPYERDPRIVPAVNKPGNNSYPSGHTSDAAVWANVLTAAFPGHDAAFQDQLHEVMWCRQLGGVHFPTDTEAGLLIGNAIARRMLASPAMAQAIAEMVAEAAPFLGRNAAAPAANTMETPPPPLPAAAPPPLPLNVLTFNLRFDNPADGANAWPHRKELAADVFRTHGIDLAGLQEALKHQIEDLQNALGDYAYIGVGRDDGKTQGEYAPIFYRSRKLEVGRQGTFWLSETPGVAGSKAWGASLPRIATWGIFRHKESGRRFFAINTHFDHASETARQNSAKLLIQQIGALSENLPVILTGDFNSQESSPAIQTLTGDAGHKLTNSRVISRAPHTGGDATFNGFREKPTEETIDFIFLGPGVEVQSHGNFPGIKDGVFVSDHWPVVGQLLISP